MAHPSEHAAVFVILAVSAVTLALAVLAVRAWRASGNRRMIYLAVAFGLFSAKGIVTSTALWEHSIGHENLELIGSVFDLLIVSLLVAPLFHR